MTGATRRALGDDVLVRGAARRLALQIAALVGAAMVLLIALVALFVVRDAKAAADTLLRGTVERVDDVGDPPPGAWLVISPARADAPVQSSPGLPAELTDDLASLRARAGSSVTLADVRDDEAHPYRVATLRRGVRVVQVVLDLHEQHEQQARLVRAMAGASVVALVFAGLLGVLLGRRAVRPLAEALVLQRMFVADASHELRTPLTLLSTRAQVLDRALHSRAVDAPLLADSRGVVHDVQRLGEVVEDLLLAADPRADAGHEPVDVRAVVETVVDSAGAHAADCDVRLEYRDEAPDAVEVDGAATALRRAVLALLDNAIDHTPTGGEVTVGLRRDRGSVVVWVSDTGPGISPEAASAVRRRFHSGGHRAGRTHYGLGLALTHDVANRHGGQLRLVPSAIGATFELVLPALDG
jgi:signal transduction histidine kinase